MNNKKIPNSQARLTAEGHFQVNGILKVFKQAGIFTANWKKKNIIIVNCFIRFQFKIAFVLVSLKQIITQQQQQITLTITIGIAIMKRIIKNNDHLITALMKLWTDSNIVVAESSGYMKCLVM